MKDVSWQGLVKALLHPRLGQTGIATTIASQHGMYKFALRVYTVASNISTVILLPLEASVAS